MAIDLSAVPVQGYVGTPFSYPIQLGRASGKCVPISINWLPYYLVNKSINQAIDISLFGGNVLLLDQVRSVYIDNLNSNVPIYIQCADTGFTVTAAPNTAGFYPLVTNTYQFLIAVVGLIPSELPLTKIYFTNIYVPAYTDASFYPSIEFALASPIISIGGSGGIISNAGIIVTGSGYTAATLAVTGGGGLNAILTGTLDIYGRFTSITIDAPGQNFVGTPTITATAAQNSIAAWINTNYGAGALVAFGGFYYSSTSALIAQGTYATWNNAAFYSTNVSVEFNGIVYQSTVGNIGKQPPNNLYWTQVGVVNLAPGISPYWANSGVPVNQVAQFTCSIVAPVGSISLQASSTYGARALGDQVVNYIDAINGVGKVRANLFGTPFASGYIYLTDIHIIALSAAANLWDIRDAAGNVFLALNGNNSQTSLFEAHNCNLKLPANIEWFLNSNFFSASQTITYGFAYTYSQF